MEKYRDCLYPRWIYDFTEEILKNKENTIKCNNQLNKEGTTGQEGQSVMVLAQKEKKNADERDLKKRNWH